MAYCQREGNGLKKGELAVTYFQLAVCGFIVTCNEDVAGWSTFAPPPYHVLIAPSDLNHIIGSIIKL